MTSRGQRRDRRDRARRLGARPRVHRVRRHPYARVKIRDIFLKRRVKTASCMRTRSSHLFTAQPSQTRMSSDTPSLLERPSLEEPRPVHARWSELNGEFLDFAAENPEYLE